MSLANCCEGLGNAMCAAAPNMTLLIAARAFAGIGGGGLQTSTFMFYGPYAV